MLKSAKCGFLTLVLALLSLLTCRAETDFFFDVTAVFGTQPPDNTNRVFKIAAASPFANQFFYRTSDVAGHFYISNVLATTYVGTMLAPPSSLSFSFYVDSTNMGVVPAQNRTSIPASGVQTFPAGQTAPSFQAALNIFQLNGQSLSNAFYPLFSNPSNYINASQLSQATNGFVDNSITNGLVNITLLNLSSNALASQTVTANTVTNISSNQVFVATGTYTSLVHTNPSSVLYTSSLPALTNQFAVTNGPTIFNPIFPTGISWTNLTTANGLGSTNVINGSKFFYISKQQDQVNDVSRFNFGESSLFSTNVNNLAVPDFVQMIVLNQGTATRSPELVVQGDNGLVMVEPSFQGSGFITTISASNGIASSGSEKLSGGAMVGGLVVTNGATNLTLTANTVLLSDANKKIVSLANVAGGLTNDGSGNVGYAAFVTLQQTTNAARYQVSNAPSIYNPGIFGTVALSNVIGIPNTLGQDNITVNSTNGGVTIRAQTNGAGNGNVQAIAINGGFLEGENGNASVQVNGPLGGVFIDADDANLHGGQIILQSPGGTKFQNNVGPVSTFNLIDNPASTNVMLENPAGLIVGVPVSNFLLAGDARAGITNAYGTNALTLSVNGQNIYAPTNFDAKGGSNFLFSLNATSSNALASLNSTASNAVSTSAATASNFLAQVKLAKTNDTSYGQSATNFSLLGNVGFGPGGLSTNLIGNSTNYLAFVNAGSGIVTNGAFIWASGAGVYTNWLTGAIVTNNTSAWLLQTNGVTLYSLAGSSPIGTYSAISGALPAPTAVFTAAINDHMLLLGYFSVTNLNSISNIIVSSVTVTTTNNFIANNNGNGTNTSLKSPILTWNVTGGLSSAANGGATMNFQNMAAGMSNTNNLGAGLGAAVLSGATNLIQNHGASVIAGGMNNIINGFAQNGGGILAGVSNFVTGVSYSSIVGGAQNINNAYYSFIGGGTLNDMQNNAQWGVIGGGNFNTNNGLGGVIPGGQSNFISGSWSTAEGRNVKIAHDFVFAWSDGTPVNSTTNSQVLLSATNGVSVIGPMKLAGSAMTNSGIYYASNTFNIFGVTNAMPNFSTWTGSSNGTLVQVYYSNGVAFVSPLGSGGGGGGGSGSVTSVGLSMPGEFSTAGSPVTTSGTLTVTRTADANFLGFSATNIGKITATGTVDFGSRITSAGLVVTNGTTNLTLTAGTVIEADANKQVVSRANAAGLYANTGSGPSWNNAPTFSAANIQAGTIPKAAAGNDWMPITNAVAWTNTLPLNFMFPVFTGATNQFQAYTVIPQYIVTKPSSSDTNFVVEKSDGSLVPYSFATLLGLIGGGSQTPLAQTVNGAGFSITNVGTIDATTVQMDSFPLGSSVSTRTSSNSTYGLFVDFARTSSGGQNASLLASNVVASGNVTVTGGSSNWFGGTNYLGGNSAPFTTTAQGALHTVALNKGWTNDFNRQADLIINVTITDAATGVPILAFTNTTTGESYTNSPNFGITGSPVYNINYIDISPNDFGSFSNYSTGTGTSIIINSANWKLK